MAPCYSKNAILKGTIDYFCLVCDTYLKTEEDHMKHLLKPIHKKNFESTQYVKDFEDDCIRKTKNGYFCEFCNELLTIMARVKVHVTKTSHTNNRCMMVFERDGSNVIAFDQVIVNERSWNGLNAESCAVCNTEYDDEVIHKNQKKHIINLIQSIPEVDNDKNIYRKIDELMFQCLTCNMVLGLSDKKTHFDGDDHKKQYQNCLVTNNTNGGEKDSDENEDGSNVENIKEITSDKSEGRIDYYMMNHGYLLCILCCLGVDPKDKPSHIYSRDHKIKLEQRRERIKEIIKAGGNDKDLFNFITEFELNDIYITLDGGSNFCMKCADSLSDSVDEIKQHITKHNRDLKKKNEDKSRDKLSHKMNDKSEDVKENIKHRSEDVKENIKKRSEDVKENIKKRSEDVKEKIKDRSEDVKEKIKNRSEDVKEKIKHRSEDVKEKIKNKSEDVNEKIRDRSEDFKETSVKEIENVQPQENKNNIKTVKDKIQNIKHSDEAKQLDKIKLIKKTTHLFIETLTCVKFMIFNDVVINNKCCISFASFTFMASNKGEIECAVCKILTNFEHFNTEKHRNMLNSVPVVTNVENEFVREINSNIFHCGFCNMIVFSWNDMLEHFNSTQHTNSKLESEWKMEMYLNEISKHKKKSAPIPNSMEMHLLRNMFQNYPF